MEEEMITVMGATGHTGKEIVKLLLDAGTKVRAVGRSVSKLAEFDHANIDVFAGDASDSSFLTKAFRGADAVYTLLPYDPHSSDYFTQQNQLGEAIITAIQDADVRRVVFLSSVGADQPVGTGFIASLHAQEQRLQKLVGRDVLILRPGSFFENFFAMLDLIQQEGIIGDAVSPDVQIPMIATRDIANVAARALQTRNWKGIVVRELLGPRDLAYAEATRIIGEQIGKPDLPYIQFPYADMIDALVQMGFSEDFANLHVELARALNEGRVRSLESRNPDNTTPTRFEEFAVDLAHAYQASIERES